MMNLDGVKRSHFSDKSPHKTVLHWTSAPGRDNFFLLFTCFCEKLDICGRVDPFFLAVHLILLGKLDICGRDDLFYFYFCSSLDFAWKIGHLQIYFRVFVDS